MAGHDLIDTYLAHLAHRMRWRDDADDIVAEVGDHLCTAVERSEADGLDTAEAQRRTLERFGDPDLVATAFATTSKGGVAVPTQFTKQAGSMALVAAALLPTFLIAWIIGDRIEDSTGDWGGASQAFFTIGTLMLVAATGLTLVVMLGLRERLGGLGPLGTAGVVLVGLGTVASLLSWFLLGWGSLVAVGTLLFATAMRRVDVAPRRATVAFGGAWTLGVVAWIALRSMEVGTADEWGDYWVAQWGFLGVGVTVMVLGLVGLGTWLRAEQPADIGPAEPLATA